jgi:hypothetical protein
MAPLILNPGNRWRQVINFTPPSNLPPVPIEQEGWAPQSFWRFWRGEKLCASAGIQTPNCVACSVVKVPTALSLPSLSQ